MPTENRSSNTEMVNVPRADIEALLKEADHMSGHTTASNYEEVAGCIRHMRAFLAQPAPLPHAEPLAWMVGTAFWWTKEEAERDAAATGLPVVAIGPVAGPGEVERLRSENEQLRGVIKHSDSNIQPQSLRISNQRAELDERDALLEEAWAHDIGTPLKRKIKAALSASAEPSAPGDGIRDERDYAIEHAGYLADAADQVLADYQAYTLAQMLEKEAGDDGDAEHEEAVDSARDELHEGLANLRSMAYEFRKRRSQASNVASAESETRS